MKGILYQLQIDAYQGESVYCFDCADDAPLDPNWGEAFEIEDDDAEYVECDKCGQPLVPEQALHEFEAWELVSGKGQRS